MARQLRISAFILTALAVPFLFCTPASAGGFGCGSYVWSSPYPADLTDLYNVGAIPLPPYFALHPPVYYDVPIARTYGYGPWAYPPYVTTPEIVQPEPEIIQNKFVPRPAKQDSEPLKTASTPVRIRNPYVIEAEKPEEPVLAAR